MIYVLTCDEADAVHFLNGLPDGEPHRATVVATKGLADAVGQALQGVETWAIVERASIATIRARLAGAQAPITIVTGPDYGEPSHRRRYVRRRLLAPWVIPPATRVDLLLIGAGGHIRRRWPQCSRARLLTLLYPPQAALGAFFAVLVVLNVSAGIVTLVRLMPRLARTEIHACQRNTAGIGIAEADDGGVVRDHLHGPFINRDSGSVAEIRHDSSALGRQDDGSVT